VSSATTVVGTGTPASCTGAAFVSAVANGGIITFDCGPDPTTIVLSSTAKVFNDKGTKLVIDGGNKVTLSGGGKVRILYMATCDEAQVYPPGPGDCNTNPGVQLVVQNITFVEAAEGIADRTTTAAGARSTRRAEPEGRRSRSSTRATPGSDVGGAIKLDYLIDPGSARLGQPGS
jgi:hypothetical protein